MHNTPHATLSEWERESVRESGREREREREREVWREAGRTSEVARRMSPLAMTTSVKKLAWKMSQCCLNTGMDLQTTRNEDRYGPTDNMHARRAEDRNGPTYAHHKLNTETELKLFIDSLARRVSSTRN